MALKLDHHVQYGDLNYLTVAVDGERCVLELHDTSLEHTGAREMGVRKADAVLLCYGVFDAESFHEVAAVADDFRRRPRGKMVRLF